MGRGLGSATGSLTKKRPLRGGGGAFEKIGCRDYQEIQSFKGGSSRGIASYTTNTEAASALGGIYRPSSSKSRPTSRYPGGGKGRGKDALHLLPKKKKGEGERKKLCRKKRCN